MSAIEIMWNMLDLVRSLILCYCARSIFLRTSLQPQGTDQCFPDTPHAYYSERWISTPKGRRRLSTFIIFTTLRCRVLGGRK